MIPWVLAFSVAAQLPDSARQARYEHVFHDVTESLDAVRRAAAAFQTDLGRASVELVLERAGRIYGRCAKADSVLARQQSLLAEGVYTPAAAAEQTRLSRETGRLRGAFARCRREWKVPERPSDAMADSLRAWGPYRTSQLDSALHRFTAVLLTFMKRADIKNPAVS